MNESNTNPNVETWIAPAFEEFEANMECTAYSSETESDDCLR